VVHWTDRRLGRSSQDVSREVGDFVLRRADGLWAYQLAVVVDDADQGVTDVVRGEDLADNTARQILLQRALGLPTPSYLHTPLVLGRTARSCPSRTARRPSTLARPDRLAALHAAAARARPARHNGRQSRVRWPPGCGPGALLYNRAR
jgi:glutamyl-Q tRNA(Asp) synthetase